MGEKTNVTAPLDVFHVPGLPVLAESVQRAQRHLAADELPEAAEALRASLQAAYAWQKAARELMEMVADLQTEVTELRKRRDALLVANNLLVEERRHLVGLSSASCTVLSKEAYEAWRGWMGYEHATFDWDGLSPETKRVFESVASAIVVAVRAQVARQERENLIALLEGEA